MIIKQQNWVEQDKPASKFTLLQNRRLYSAANDIIERLPAHSINQLLEGYSEDVDKLLTEIVNQVDLAMNFGRSLDTENLSYIDNLAAAMDERLRILSFNYFCATVLSNFMMGWRNLEWGNLTQLFPWSSYLCSRGSGKCMSLNELVVMYDGSLKKVQDVKVGDLVMGPDSTPRKVLQLHRGKAPMYKIHQTYAKDYCVNEGHLVCIQWDKEKYIDHGSKGKKYIGREICKEEIPVEKIPQRWLYRYKKIYGYRVKGWDLPEKSLSIEPYFLGLWLGDGNSHNQVITTIDPEICLYLDQYADRLGGIHKRRFCSFHQKELYSCIVNIPGSKRNFLNENLEKLNVLRNKHIPDIYMRSSRQQRLQLLAGLIDTDGSLEKTKKNGGKSFIFANSNERLINDVRQLALSLGFRCVSVRKRVVSTTLKTNGKKYDLKGNIQYQCNISGDIDTIPTKIERKKCLKIEKIQDFSRSSLSITPVGKGDYYGFSLDGDHKFLLSDGTVVHNSYEFAYAFPLWRLYSYTKPIFYAGDTIDNKNRKETALITNMITLAKVHVGKIIEEIETNPILSNKLNPNKKAKLGETMIETENGGILHVRGKDSMIRGLHVGAAIVDDMPDESSIYSDEQREKLKETFRGTISPIVEPYGYFLISGTPYSTAPNELYNIIKADKRFAVFEYPIIFPDGRPLAPDRYTFDDIIQKKEELGTLVFSREYLVVPIADSSTIFPYEFLMKSTIGMENIAFADAIDYFPFKLQRVVVGCDFAVSGNIGADYTVYTVWGIDFMDNYYLIAIHRQKGMSHNEQVDKIVLFNTLFKPNKIVCEANGFQSILSGLARERGLKNIETFTTTEGNKKDLHTGLPSLSAMFERGQIKIPYAVGPTREMVKIIFGEFSSITFRSDRGKLEAVGSHDDICMSSFIAINSLREDSHITVQINTI